MKIFRYSLLCSLRRAKKYIIQYPDVEYLKTVPNCHYSDIEQIYLISDDDVSERIRKRGRDGSFKYYHTIKRRINDYVREEDEKEITKAEYEELKKRANPELNIIYKTRYVIPYKGYMMEIDVFPFWDRQAYLEVELNKTEETPVVPPYIKCMCDVTCESCYTNRALAENIPDQIL